MNQNIHCRTPELKANDPRGLPIRQVAYLRKVAGGALETLITRQRHDTIGRQIEQWDPRLFGNAPRPNLATVYRLSGEALRVDSVDSGRRLSLAGVAGEILQHWDQRANHWRTTYDNQLRVIAVEENAQPNVETFTYADVSADPKHNRRGQLLEQIDPSGSLSINGFNLLGQPLNETRTFADGLACTTVWRYSALGTVLSQTDACDHRQQLRYNVAGQLQQVQLQIEQGKNWQTVLNDAQYNAAGQIITQLAGNDVLSTWTYDAADGRLFSLKAQKKLEPPLQDFEYFYDRMGNVTRIDDLTFTPSHFANQRVDGHRTFTYDSLYRLTSATGYDDAPPSDNPGRPGPTDPKDRRNYTQTYTYDTGGNLIKLNHVREGASHTREMFIDPNSNRGVRWAPDYPDPEFDKLFDRHGNQLALQPGHPMCWDARDQLASVTLVHRDSDPDDEEHYRYSQGSRVYKRHDTYAPSNSHSHEVRYLPGLEIRTRDNGEELHVITLAAGVGSVRCLHWAALPPSGIDPDQLRYTLEDHLGSCLMELDQKAQMITHEGYYPYGATAWMAARSLIEVAYKFIRYSGKEMDESGLYYYGARYYAPWVQRWISADPAGAVDGTNLFAFVGNNPLRYVDPVGGAKSEAVIMLSSEFISVVGGFAEQTNALLHNIIHQKHLKRNLLANLAAEVGKGVMGYEAGAQAAGFIDSIVPSVPGVPYLGAGGLIGGNIAGDVTGAMADPIINGIADGLGVTLGPLIPQTSKMSVAQIDRGLGITEPVKEIKTWKDFKDDRIHPFLNSVLNPDFLMNRVMSSWLSIIPGAINMFARAIEVEDIKNGLDPVKIGKIKTMYTDWQKAVEERSAWYEEAFEALGTDALDASVTGGASISLATLREQTHAALADIAHGLRGIAAYEEMNTTDNRFLRQQAHPVSGHHSRLYNWWTHSG
ncbi:RHS repeat-associated core domain-containing protein [Pseudomonas sp. 6D_7.1_Bac1]|uniref:RHS repeat-associated core domain-containing protein n=1 Tax=Pseudomonas sp. 6D_7.1_Bac1 TaxID=2971615 RepID=UPI0021C9713F|nr:RHS repeat-associated core domain-containing protein [Pseudomonas sp. 6D_7.1_Bac1]MCU1751280.1 RHS repeat-associated core domain-containing protein [Pseudomonas sp. 6D_7.1_Bac1]